MLKLFNKIIILIFLLCIFFTIFNKFKGGNLSNNIPKKIISTYHTKNKIPDKVFKNIKQYAPNYEYIIFDDNDIINFLNKYYNKDVVDKFNVYKGAHKADLFRYCYLYKFGGIYIDIKTELIMNIDDIFNKNDIDLYTVMNKNNKSIYQGVIASKPNNPLFLKLIDHMLSLKVPKNSSDPRTSFYHLFTRQFYLELLKYYNKNTILSGFTKDSNNKYNLYLFSERCSPKEYCSDGLDRYNLCCNIYDDDKKIIKTRYSDYPWN